MSTEFFKSSYSGANQSCVEVAHRADAVLVRDSKYDGPAETQPIVQIPAEFWTQFLALALGGRSGQLGGLRVIVRDDGSASLVDACCTLAYTPGEWDAFVKGIVDQQFDRPA
ncbi:MULTISPECIES: DUF397 domain-containing protein [unclassified Nocardia]|uniref:DUF397 domain-containing protein n=1 Tax=unclassified Nocardia TaxID=2637762 RepID=UPI00278C8203|nr:MULTISPECIES: DUF397 domain-containing protein [unclassified Nocardia]